MTRIFFIHALTLFVALISSITTYAEAYDSSTTSPQEFVRHHVRTLSNARFYVWLDQALGQETLTALTVFKRKTPLLGGTAYSEASKKVLEKIKLTDQEALFQGGIYFGEDVSATLEKTSGDRVALFEIQIPKIELLDLTQETLTEMKQSGLSLSALVDERPDLAVGLATANDGSFNYYLKDASITQISKIDLNQLTGENWLNTLSGLGKHRPELLISTLRTYTDTILSKVSQTPELGIYLEQVDTLTGDQREMVRDQIASKRFYGWSEITHTAEILSSLEANSDTVRSLVKKLYYEALTQSKTAFRVDTTERIEVLKQATDVLLLGPRYGVAADKYARELRDSITSQLITIFENLGTSEQLLALARIEASLSHTMPMEPSQRINAEEMLNSRYYSVFKRILKPSVSHPVDSNYKMGQTLDVTLEILKLNRELQHIAQGSRITFLGLTKYLQDYFYNYLMSEVGVGEQLETFLAEMANLNVSFEEIDRVSQNALYKILDFQLSQIKSVEKLGLAWALYSEQIFTANDPDTSKDDLVGKNNKPVQTEPPADSMRFIKKAFRSHIKRLKVMDQKGMYNYDFRNNVDKAYGPKSPPVKNVPPRVDKPESGSIGDVQKACGNFLTPDPIERFQLN